ncbi:MAG TPA: bifunctional DNA-formamidopyrimidine glycosylase/DNA-(apurinic or apyrimidinic site) lyase [Pirellulales bacterium]|jgi:formamidopyrimidine-DNA glycosylase|nr:bifunctional DNA-formamidopyrimidine glycosylase/DNA-(apurinic or apyrimidinic site) lyase [Pirellulales bacterium]
MPELPEVETMCRGVSPVVGSRIVGVVRPKCKLKPITMFPALAGFRRRAVGRTIERVDRIGKRVVLRLDGPRGDSIVIEPRMTGLVLLAEPPNREHLRLVLQLAQGSASELLFWDRRGLGVVRLVASDEFGRHYGTEVLGPDALTVTPKLLRQRLGASQREIKVALLDQKGVAGIGNLYASEILHVAGIHPARRCHRLKPGDWQALATAIVDVLADAIRYEGSTLSDGTYRNVQNEAGGYQNHHRAYDRAGEVCRTCRKGTILRIVQAQRSTFFCPQCQPKRPRR